LELSARKQNEKAILHFPLFGLEEREANQQLLNAVGIGNYKYYSYNSNLNMVFIELEDKQAVLSVSPDFAAMLKIDNEVKEVVVTARSTDGEYDFYSRCFCPGLGINEDPVTGAIHSVLTPYWQQKLGKNKLRSYQCSTRGGYLDLEVLDDKTLEISADAVIIFEGQLRLP
jgi:PhzF family phenazine biosynthesis protein